MAAVKLLSVILAVFTALLSPSLASAPLSNSQFVPAQSFKVNNLLRNIDLTKSYLRETLSFVIENIGTASEEEFFLTFPFEVKDGDLSSHISFLDIKEKGDSTSPLTYKIGEYNTDKYAQYFTIKFTKPLNPGENAAIQVSTAYSGVLHPQPSKIKQADVQHLLWTGSRYAFLPYESDRQRTKIKLPDRGASAYSKSATDPAVEGTVLTYGPYTDVPSFASKDIQVRYEYTFPITEVVKLEREIWVSHYGGNLATEEKYWLKNAAATLSDQFARIRWQASAISKERSVAIKGLNILLRPGSRDVYYTDEIGNVSTSNFRQDFRGSNLELRPRYPIFGGWNYSFTIGWNHDLGRSLKLWNVQPGQSERYLLKVPFLEGPDNVSYGEVDLSVLLPEGSSDVEVKTTLSQVVIEESLRKSHLDSVGRTVITLKSQNLLDEHRRHEVYISYTYSASASIQKPVLVITTIAVVFLAFIILLRLDFSISKLK
ncbi:Ribophorin I [Lipomyces japonicus]|uniref:Ribophorin I n=1 Tax=Lipomyces japonicus TaxID=56871 RepID=UPI0034CF536C